MTCAPLRVRARKRTVRSGARENAVRRKCKRRLRQKSKTARNIFIFPRAIFARGGDDQALSALMRAERREILRDTVFL